MTAFSDAALVTRFYGARGERHVIDEVMSQDVVWDITPGFPLGGVYTGLDNVLSTFFAPVGALFSSMTASTDQLFADGEGHVTALGQYVVVGQGGDVVKCRFVHAWTITDGKVSHLHQAADSHLLQRLIDDTDGHLGSDDER